MKDVWLKLSERSRFYIFSFLNLFFSWLILNFLNVEIVNIIFFMTAFVWHFALLTPGLKEQVLGRNQRFSFLTVITKINHYMQLFISFRRYPRIASYGSAIIRAISPLVFTFVLFVFGGGGSILFTLLGSLSFEILYFFTNKDKKMFFSPLGHTVNPDIPPMIPNEEKSHE